MQNNSFSSLNKINYKQVNAKVVKKQNKKDEPKQSLNIADMIAKAKQKASETHDCFKDRNIGLFPIGTRVFHIQFGVGKIKEILKEDNNSSYIVEFTKAGEKTLDTTTSGLKIF